MIQIIAGIIVIMVIIMGVLFVYRLKFQFNMIKLDKAEEEIGMYLDSKKDLLKETRPIINKELKKEDFLQELNLIDAKEMDYFEKHNILKNLYNELFKTLDDNEKLLKSDSLLTILDELNDNEEEIVGAIKFYNDTVVDFNHLVRTFPASILAFFKNYKEKEFYSNEKREIFEILNEKQKEMII